VQENAMSSSHEPNESDPATAASEAPQLSHTVEASEAGERADVVLGRVFPDLSRRVARRLALDGALEIDGRKAKPSHRIREGQRLTLRVVPSGARSFELEVLELRSRFVYVHKPAGIHTVALRPGEANCLASAVASRYPECAEASEDSRESGALHRLDRGTSGVVAFARSREAWAEGRDAFRNQSVRKDYLALSRNPWPPRLPEGGLPTWLDDAAPLAPFADFDDDGECFRIRAALGPHELPSRVQVRLDGRRCTSFIARVSGAADWSCLRVRLETGHRHQARAHLAWVGLPLLGDEIYGSDEAPRLALHAMRLDLGAVDPGPAICDLRYVESWRRGELIPAP